MDIDISYSGFVGEFFSLVESLLNGALVFADSIIMVMTTPILDVLRSITEVLPDFLEWPIEVVEALIFLFADNAESLTVWSFVFSSAIILFVGFYFARSIIDIVRGIVPI